MGYQGTALELSSGPFGQGAGCEDGGKEGWEGSGDPSIFPGVPSSWKLEALNAFSSIPEVKSCARQEGWAELWPLLLRPNPFL